MKHTSVKLNVPCEFINVTPLNPLISRCHIKVCWVGDEPNRNKSIISKEVARDLANSLPGSPIVGYYNEGTKDFEGHERELEIKDGEFFLKDITRPYGFVDLNAKVWFQKFIDDGMFEREYLMTEGWLWTGQYPECKRVVEEGNNQSMELDKNLTQGFWTKQAKEGSEFFIINEAIMSKLCILGEETEPCFEGSNIESPKYQFSFDNDFKEQLFSMMNEIKDLLGKGGAVMNDENKVIEQEPVVEEPVVVEEPAAAPQPTEEPAQEPVIEEPVVEEPVVEEPATEPVVEEPIVEEPAAEPVVEEPAQEPVSGGEAPAAYNLEEIVEYQNLLVQFNDLQNSYNTLKGEFDTLTQTANELTSFKLGIEKQEKQALIDSFYMLSKELKKDVQDNIDTYSKEDIEAKLSIICVRNRISFEDNSENKNNTSAPATSYSLNSIENNEEDIPAWIKAMDRVANV